MTHTCDTGTPHWCHQCTPKLEFKTPQLDCNRLGLMDTVLNAKLICSSVHTTTSQDTMNSIFFSDVSPTVKRQ